MTPRPSRRRFIKIFAAQSAALLAGNALSARARARTLKTWHGIALGAEATIQLNHENPKIASRLLKSCVSEIQRLENVFSLYDIHSSLSRLNRDGFIANPPIELTELLQLTKEYGDKTNGAFDVTIHPIVEALRTGQPPPGLSLVNYRQITITPERITLEHPKAAITLNGIAQGYITDAIADLLTAEGIHNTLVELGEKRALGTHPEGRPWNIGLADPSNPTHIASTIELNNQALASSGGYGTPFKTSGQSHHLIDPRTGRSTNHFSTIHVLANRATQADALSTALSVCSKEEIDAILTHFPNTETHFVASQDRCV